MVEEIKNATVIETVRDYVGYIDDPVFDAELLSNINTAIAIAYQLGVVTSDFINVNRNTKWSQIISEDVAEYKYPLVVQYINVRTKILFDPPPSNSKEMFESLIQELAYRLKC